MTLHGLLLVNKETGITSHDVVAKARKILGTKEVGHCGTLDPLASGLLVLLIGQATKLSQYILDADKSYRVGFKLGFETDTLDSTGITLRKQAIQVDANEVLKQALNLSGEFQWPVPHFSAVKVDGEKLYEKARRGEVFETPLKQMKFWNLENKGADPSELKNLGTNLEAVEFIFDLSCSKGSYIRSWVQELGQRLGCGATMSSLIRTSSLPYELNMAQTLEDVSLQFLAQKRLKCFVPLAYAMPQAKRIRVQGQAHNLIKNGQISYDLKGQLIQIFQPGIDEIVQIIDSSQNLLALIGHERQKGFHIRRVFHYEKPSS